MKKILWETYFDTTVTRKMGRRVKKNFQTQRLMEIINAMNLSYSVTEAKYPKIPWKTVKKIEVEWEGSKEELIKKIESSSSSES
ncbi:MAG: signal recognition particle subunit SRP19/SEC65 family protein [Thermoplasmatales archaeon]|jgi:signal recognition particle subunit SEC65